MKKAIILSLLMILSCSVFGQTVSDSISIKTFLGGCKVYQGGQQITLSKLGTILKSNDLAYTQYQKAQPANALSTIIGGVGGFLIGYPLGTVLAGGKMNWKMFGIGSGLAVISIPIANKCVKQIKSSVDTFNGALKTNPQPTTAFKMGLSGNGLSIAMTF
jgi:hypothetical protein